MVFDLTARGPEFCRGLSISVPQPGPNAREDSNAEYNFTVSGTTITWTDNKVYEIKHKQQIANNTGKHTPTKSNLTGKCHQLGKGAQRKMSRQEYRRQGENTSRVRTLGNQDM